MDEELETVILTDDEGNEIEFKQIASIVFGEDEHYVILQPVEIPEGLTEDDAFVFDVKFTSDTEGSLFLVEDDEIIDKVFAEYNRLLDEEEAEIAENEGN